MDSRNLILAIDQGTSSSRTLIFDLSHRPHKTLAQASVDFKQHYPKQDWVEHDLEEIWQSTLKSMALALEQASLDPTEIKGISLTNQRETLCVFDKKSGKPLHHGIVWQCKRSFEICEKLKSEGKEDDIRNKTGLLLDPYFTGTKIKWLLETNPELKEKIFSGEALLGTIDTYLLYRLTNGRSFATEPSNASRTLLYNLKQKKWDQDLIDLMGGFPKSSLPEIKDSHANFGQTKGLEVITDDIPIHGILGDQQAALFGHHCLNYGDAKCTYGTGAFFLMNTEKKCVINQSGLLSTVAWQLGGEVHYALEGSCFIAGAAVSFLRDNLEIIKDVKETNLTEEIKAAPDLYFVPALCGLGAPWWLPKIKGAFLGLTRATTKKQLLKATLEGICFQVEDLISVFKKEAGLTLKEIHVDGGACANDSLMTTQTELSCLKVIRPRILETTAYGSALMASYGLGYLSLNDLKGLQEHDKIFELNKINEGLRGDKKKGWLKAIKTLQMNFY